MSLADDAFLIFERYSDEYKEKFIARVQQLISEGGNPLILIERHKFLVLAGVE